MSWPICMNTTHALKIYLDIGIQTSKHDLRISTSPLPCRLVHKGTWETYKSIAFTSVLFLEDSEKSLTLIHVFFKLGRHIGVFV
jgi:hypothetical protein